MRKNGKGKKKINKKPLMKARQKIVEVKKRDSSEIAQLNKNPDGTAGNHYPLYTYGANAIVNNDGIYIFDLPAFYRQSHGFENRNCVGNSITGKWLDFRVSMNFPDGTDSIVNPINLFLVHGYVKQSLSHNETTVPTLKLTTQANLRSHIYAQLTEYFNDRADFLVPRDMSGSKLKILGYKRVAPNRNASITPVLSQVVPTMNRRVKFTMNRKIRLDEGTAELTNFPDPKHDTQNLFPNVNYLPFVCLYNPNFAEMKDSSGTDRQMTVRYNSTFYFTDS